MWLLVGPRDTACLVIPRAGNGSKMSRSRPFVSPMIDSPYPHPLEIGAVDAVAGRDDPPLGDEGTPTADPLAQEALFDDGHL